MSRFIATWFYSGLLPKAPGTWGSLAALPFAYAMYLAHFSITAVLISTLIIFILGWWVTDIQTRGKDNHDPGEIVIDEVAGQWIALIPLFEICRACNPPTMLITFLFIIGFGLFRLFDIFKPFPISWADRMNTSLGVMLDDILAGIMAAIILTLFIQIFLGGYAGL